MKTASILSLLLAFAAIVPAHGERRHEKRSEATHVLEGEVVAVYERKTKAFRHYIVQLRVEKIEKGKNVAVGDFLYASCFLRDKVSRPVMPGPGGHAAVPTEGQQVKVFLNRNRGLWEGVYPDWFDVVKTP